jgi:hypothetical protein
MRAADALFAEGQKVNTEKVQMQMWLWFDRFDDSMVSIGCEFERYGKTRKLCWGQIHIDGVSDVFGTKVAEELSGIRVTGQDCIVVTVDGAHIDVDLG